MGRHNSVYNHAVLGERPQHLKYDGEATRVEIGDHNIFREHVTVHRGTTAVVGDAHRQRQLPDGRRPRRPRLRRRQQLHPGQRRLIGGHCVVEDNVFMSGNSALHQYVRAGRLSLLSGCSGSTMDIPPFIIQQRINCVVGVNVVGMRRAGIPTEHIDAVRRAFHILYLERMVLPAALERIDRELGTVAEVAEMTAFIRASRRGINLISEREALIYVENESVSRDGRAS